MSTLEQRLGEGLCYSVLYRKKWETLSEFDKHLSPEPKYMKSYGERVFPRGTTRVLAVGQTGQITLPEMTYSLVPTWSKEPTVKWATYNARLERKNPETGENQKIYEMPTWRESIGSSHCVVPVTEFFESCGNEGTASGFEVAFHKSDFSNLYIAGIYSVWRGLLGPRPVTTCTFAAITTDPSNYITTVGHDRSPLFLSKDYSKLWLTEKFETGESAYQFLKTYKQEPDLIHTKIRKLKGAS